MTDIKVNYIYLLQEREFIKTKENIYKIGRTTQVNNERLKQYPKGSVLLFQMICNDCVSTEYKILKIFNEDFILRDDVGNEYFEGDYQEMIDIIYKTIKNEQKSSIIEEKKTIVKKKFDSMSIIKELFPDYLNDEAFGGIKKYVMITTGEEPGEYDIVYINPEYGSCFIDGRSNIPKIETDNIDPFIMEISGIDHVDSNLNYFGQLIENKNICVDEVYDINCDDFIGKLNATKNNIMIENYDEFYDKTLKSKNHISENTTNNKIRNLFYCNVLINGQIYANTYDYGMINNIKLNELGNFSHVKIDIGDATTYVPVIIYKINSKYYDCQTFLREYMPYNIRSDDENNFYILNRDYVYIGLCTKSLDYNYGNYAGYLYKSGHEPWTTEENYKKVCKKYKEIRNNRNLRTCLNWHKNTEKVLSLLD